VENNISSTNPRRRPLHQYQFPSPQCSRGFLFQFVLICTFGHIDKCFFRLFQAHHLHNIENVAPFHRQQNFAGEPVRWLFQSLLRWIHSFYEEGSIAESYFCSPKFPSNLKTNFSKFFKNIHLYTTNAFYGFAYPQKIDIGL